jgi:hypothetical protein
MTDDRGAALVRGRTGRELSWDLICDTVLTSSRKESYEDENM